ncbi:RloB family protein [Shewanella xiamenensis]|uniref:RloB family protein n=1 Tax=Shewanella xiamenensis TaxID=332186 RepID=UPI0024A6378F|nr:RloB family protein [Shewanella xiamenensis]MDI5875563.1 RloB family protein [Shewanella xiamenensis]
MGTDDLHKKSKGRHAAILSRKLGTRKPYEKLLIVCEGSKTEPLYFKEVISYYKLSTANVVVDNNLITCPLKLFQKAKDIVKEHAKLGTPFDSVYCVFDKDSHVHYQDALDAISAINQKPQFYAINSVPCFEYWLLLHFKATTKPYYRSGKQSPADTVIADLKKEIPNYSKAKEGIFLELKDKLEFAINNSEKSRINAINTGTDNPTTNIDHLVKKLINLKNN